MTPRPPPTVLATNRRSAAPSRPSEGVESIARRFNVYAWRVLTTVNAWVASTRAVDVVSTSCGEKKFRKQTQIVGHLFQPSRHVRRQTNELAWTPLTTGNQSHRLDSCRRRVSNPRGAVKQDCRRNIPRALWRHLSGRRNVSNRSHDTLACVHGVY